MSGALRPRFVVRPSDRASDIDLTVVIPAFEEALRLPAVLRSLRDHVDHQHTEIIVVDDGSKDDTIAAAREHGAWSPHLRVLEHGVNRGKGAAVRTGVMVASGDLVAFVDADDATDLDALAPMCQSVQGSVGAVFGSRHAPGSVVVGSPPIRGLMGRIFNHVVKYAAGTTISDTQCGAKVFRASAARLVFADATIDGFAFDVEILRRLTALDLLVTEHPVRWQYVAGTKIRLVTPFKMLRDIVGLRMRAAPAPDAGIVCSYAAGLREIADPLDPSLVVAPGDGCSVLLPNGDSMTPTALRARLVELGLT